MDRQKRLILAFDANGYRTSKHCTVPGRLSIEELNLILKDVGNVDGKNGETIKIVSLRYGFAKGITKARAVIKTKGPIFRRKKEK